MKAGAKMAIATDGLPFPNLQTHSYITWQSKTEARPCILKEK